MKYIVKSAEPTGFTNWKAANPKASYSDITRHVKSWLKQSLLEEQHYICCYCECRIDSNNSHIEHFKPKARDKYPELQLSYSNLHASCGCNISKGEDIHCGHKKSNEYSPLLVSPLEKDCHTHFGYTLDGGISGKSNRGEESIRILHLDSELLKEQRKTLIDYFLDIPNPETLQDEINSHLNTTNPQFGEFYTMIELLF